MSITNRSPWSAFGVLLFSGFNLFLFVLYIVPGMIQIFTQGADTSLGLTLVPIIGYLLTMVNLFLIIKHFNPSATWINSGLLQGLWIGLVLGLAVSIILGLVMLLGGFNNGLAISLKGISVLLIFGLILGFIWGMILSIVGGFRS